MLKNKTQNKTLNGINRIQTEKQEEANDMQVNDGNINKKRNVTGMV